MNSNQQWPGHGQHEITELYQEMVEATPQLPIEKLIRAISSTITTITGRFAKFNNSSLPKAIPEQHHS